MGMLMEDTSPLGLDLAMDQPPWREGWRRIRQGLWRNSLTGEVWRGYQQYGRRAGNYPGVEAARSAARTARAAESLYARQLRQIARTIGDTVRGVFNPSNFNDPGFDTIITMLNQYQEMLRPWAHAQAQRMVADVNRRDATGWQKLGREIGRNVTKEIESAPVAEAIEQLYFDQMNAIIGLPANTAEHIRQSKEASADIIWELRDAAQASTVGGRWEDFLQGELRERWQAIVDRVDNAGLTARANAETVARTEVARAHSVLQAVRARHMGCVMFQWMTANDFDVRDHHRELSRRDVGFGPGVYRYDDPPELDDGNPGLPGTIYNCRCYQRPILPALD
jgi:SPP1 gp7 family putative phage head morphogenesis protein